MSTLKAVKLITLLCATALVLTGCSRFKDSKLGKFFGGRDTPAPMNAAGGIESSVLPEPIRGQQATEIPELRRVYFQFDSAALLPQAKQDLESHAQWLKSNASVHIQVEGHCDERGTQDYNYALGERRAEAVRSHLISLGIDAGRLHTISYGSERPDDPGRDDTAYAKNRRVQFAAYGG